MSQKWKSKVDWRLLDQYDPQSLEMDDFEDEDLDEAVRKRMERQSLFLKFAEKLPAGTPRYEQEDS